MVDVLEYELLRTIDRHFLHALTQFWFRVITFVTVQTMLLCVFTAVIVRDGDRLAVVVFALFGLSLSGLAAVVGVSSVQRITAWRAAFIDIASRVDGDGVIARAEARPALAYVTQISAVLPALTAVIWSAVLVAYAA